MRFTQLFTVLFASFLFRSSSRAVGSESEASVVSSLNTIPAFFLEDKSPTLDATGLELARNLQESLEWIQLGDDIDGAALDYSATSVAMSKDGSRVVIVARGNDGNGLDSGRTRIYQYDENNSSWVKLGDDIDGEAAYDFSGWSVAMSANGSRVVIGARYNDGNGANSGHARIYQYDKNNSSWAKLGDDIDGEAAGDFSGNSVAMCEDGSRVVIGAPYNGGNGSNSGHARIYQYDEIYSSWVKLGDDIDGEAAGDYSSFSVAMSANGSRVVTGAGGNDGNGADSGHARIYQYDENNSSWVKLGDDIDGEAAGDLLGWSVAMSGDGSRVVIGAYQNDGNGADSGHARIYQYDKNNSRWVKLGDDIDGEAAGDLSGYSVAMSGDGSRVVIGAPYNDGNGNNSGHARIYQYDKSNGIWAKLGADIEGEVAGDEVGYSVAMNENGSKVVIGAPFNDANGFNSGHARVFVQPPTYEITEHPTTAPTPGPTTAPTPGPTTFPTKTPTITFADYC